MAVVRYLVADVDVAVTFYTGMLGFELVEKWGPPFAMVRRDDLTVWLSGPGSSASRPLADGSKPVAGGWNRLVLETDDLESLVARLKKAGAVAARGHRLRARRKTGTGRRSLRQSDRVVRAELVIDAHGHFADRDLIPAAVAGFLWWKYS